MSPAVAVLAAAQAIALVVLLRRLAPGRTRRPAVAPVAEGIAGTTVSVVVATLNEARRIGPCLEGLHLQGAPLLEVIVVDSHSNDGTATLVDAMRERDGLFRVVNDPPLPPGWIGKVWALQHALQLAKGAWVLGVDADTEPQAGMVAGAVRAAAESGYDMVSFSPRFGGQTFAEQWLQPAMLLTLVYRSGAAGAEDPPADRVMANGQCFLAKRDTLLRHGGYAAARLSFCDDVTLARHYARLGARVGFMDGSRLYLVRSYESMRQMWREWGRSLDLKDASTPGRLWSDALLLVLAQAAPLIVLAAWMFGALDASTTWGRVLLWTNLALATVRVLMLAALAPSYDRRRLSFWLSPLADVPAVLRVLLSSLRRPTDWRGRQYASEGEGVARA